MKKILVVIIGLLIAMNIVTMTSCGRKSKIVNDGNNVESSKSFKQDKKITQLFGSHCWLHY